MGLTDWLLGGLVLAHGGAILFIWWISERQTRVWQKLRDECEEVLDEARRIYYESRSRPKS